MLSMERRLVPKKTNDIGKMYLLATVHVIILKEYSEYQQALLFYLTMPLSCVHSGVWTRVLEAIGVAAVIANGLVIGISSEFVPRLVYRYRFGPCANGTATDIQSVSEIGSITLYTKLHYIPSLVVLKACYMNARIVYRKTLNYIICVHQVFDRLH